MRNYQRYRVFTENGKLLCESLKSSSLEANQFVTRFSNMLFTEYREKRESVIGFHTLGNLISTILRKHFDDFETLTENRRSLPFKLNKFLLKPPKYVIMYDEGLGSILVDNSFPRFYELEEYIDEVINKLYRIQVDISFEIIVLSNLDSLSFEFLSSGRKKLIQ